jgi:hypothetical protein
MILKILNRSASFRGSWLYHFHDKGAAKNEDGTKSSDRVSLYGLRNLGTDDPEEAFKQMALTWHSASTLKKKAGISNKGRKCTKPLITLVLSYNTDYSPASEEIQQDIESALKLTGLTENQAVWVVHTDTANIHVHIMANAVNPENGVAVQFDNKVAERLQAWAKTKERSIGVQCPGREDPNQKGKSRKFIPAAERRARERIADAPELQGLADELAYATKQEWKELRHREQQELSAVYDRMQAIRDLGRSHKQTIKSVTASRIRAIYKKAHNPFFLTIAWLEKNEWKRLGRRTYAARRLFYIRERSLSGALINAIHLALSDMPEKKDFLHYLLSKDERKAGLEHWINQEYTGLKTKQKTKRDAKLQRIRTAEHQCYIGLSRHIQNQIQQEKDFLEVLKQEHSARRAELKAHCKSRWDSIAPKSKAQQPTNINQRR